MIFCQMLNITTNGGWEWLKRRLAMVKNTNTACKKKFQMPHSAIKIHENEKSPYGVAGEQVGLAVKRLNENQMGCWLEPGIDWEHSSCELGTRRRPVYIQSARKDYSRAFEQEDAELLREGR